MGLVWETRVMGTADLMVFGLVLMTLVALGARVKWKPPDGGKVTVEPPDET